MFDSCSTPVRLLFDSNWGNRVEQSRPKRQEPNRVEQLASIGTSRGDAELSKKSYDIKIGSVVTENDSKTSPYVISHRLLFDSLQKLGIEQESNRGRQEIT